MKIFFRLGPGLSAILECLGMATCDPSSDIELHFTDEELRIRAGSTMEVFFAARDGGMEAVEASEGLSLSIGLPPSMLLSLLKPPTHGPRSSQPGSIHTPIDIHVTHDPPSGSLDPATIRLADLQLTYPWAGPMGGPLTLSTKVRVSDTAQPSCDAAAAVAPSLILTASFPAHVFRRTVMEVDDEIFNILDSPAQCERTRDKVLGALAELARPAPPRRRLDRNTMLELIALLRTGKLEPSSLLSLPYGLPSILPGLKRVFGGAGHIVSPIHPISQHLYSDGMLSFEARLDALGARLMLRVGRFDFPPGAALSDILPFTLEGLIGLGPLEPEQSIGLGGGIGGPLPGRRRLSRSASSQRVASEGVQRLLSDRATLPSSASESVLGLGSSCGGGGSAAAGLPWPDSAAAGPPRSGDGGDSSSCLSLRLSDTAPITLPDPSPSRATATLEVPEVASASEAFLSRQPASLVPEGLTLVRRPGQATLLSAPQARLLPAASAQPSRLAPSSSIVWLTPEGAVLPPHLSAEVRRMEESANGMLQALGTAGLPDDLVRCIYFSGRMDKVGSSGAILISLHTQSFLGGPFCGSEPLPSLPSSPGGPALRAAPHLSKIFRGPSNAFQRKPVLPATRLLTEICVSLTSSDVWWEDRGGRYDTLVDLFCQTHPILERELVGIFEGKASIDTQACEACEAVVGLLSQMSKVLVGSVARAPKCVLETSSGVSLIAVAVTQVAEVALQFIADLGCFLKASETATPDDLSWCCFGLLTRTAVLIDFNARLMHLRAGPVHSYADMEPLRWVVAEILNVAGPRLIGPAIPFLSSPPIMQSSLALCARGISRLEALLTKDLIGTGYDRQILLSCCAASHLFRVYEPGLDYDRPRIEYSEVLATARNLFTLLPSIIELKHKVVTWASDPQSLPWHPALVTSRQIVLALVKSECARLTNAADLVTVVMTRLFSSGTLLAQDAPLFEGLLAWLCFTLSVTLSSYPLEGSNPVASPSTAAQLQPGQPPLPSGPPSGPSAAPPAPPAPQRPQTLAGRRWAGDASEFPPTELILAYRLLADPVLEQRIVSGTMAEAGSGDKWVRCMAGLREMLKDSRALLPSLLAPGTAAEAERNRRLAPYERHRGLYSAIMIDQLASAFGLDVVPTLPGRTKLSYIGPFETIQRGVLMLLDDLKRPESPVRESLLCNTLGVPLVAGVARPYLETVLAELTDRSVCSLSAAMEDYKVTTPLWIYSFLDTFEVYVHGITGVAVLGSGEVWGRGPVADSAGAIEGQVQGEAPATFSMPAAPPPSRLSPSPEALLRDVVEVSHLLMRILDAKQRGVREELRAVLGERGDGWERTVQRLLGIVRIAKQQTRRLQRVMAAVRKAYVEIA